MSEERLIEITSEIYKEHDPMYAVGYISTYFNESDIYILLRYVRSSKYNDMSLGDALVQFSYDYLKSKDIIIKPNIADFVEEQISHAKDGIVDEMTYFSRMLAEDDSMRVVGRSHGR